MKKSFVVVLLAACILLLAACAGLAASDPVPLPGPEEPEEEAYEAPQYELEPTEAVQKFCAEDGTELASYRYVLPSLRVSNWEALSQEDQEKAEQAVAAYNAVMNSLMEDCVERGEAMYGDALEAYQNQWLTAQYCDEVDYAGQQMGDLLSNSLSVYTYTGGAHPNHYKTSYLFDLRSSQFIDPTLVAEDPEAFRTEAAALLVEKAEGHSEHTSFWEDYAEVISHWNEGTVLFDGEGMQVVYSPYELGPYAIGEVVLRLDWEELSPLIGESGMELLGEQQVFK